MQRIEKVDSSEDWDSRAFTRPDDPLLGCLLFLARLHGKRTGADTLTAGLPLVDHRLTPKLFVRAAARVGISAKVLPRDLADISSLVLPVVLLLHGKHASVLLRRDRDEDAEIVLPESGTGVTKITFKEQKHSIWRPMLPAVRW